MNQKTVEDFEKEIIVSQNNTQGVLSDTPVIIAKSDKSSEDLPSPETAVSASPNGGLS